MFHGLDVVGQQAALVFCGPSEQRSILEATQAGLLCCHDVEMGVASEEASDDLTIEILVRKKGDHGETGFRLLANRSLILS